MAKRKSQEFRLIHRGQELARRFAAAIMAGDLPAAYVLTSTRLRSRQSSQAFAAQHQTAWRTHGQPAGVIESELGGVGIDLEEPDSGYPVDVPPADRVREWRSAWSRRCPTGGCPAPAAISG